MNITAAIVIRQSSAPAFLTSLNLLNNRSRTEREARQVKAMKTATEARGEACPEAPIFISRYVDLMAAQKATKKAQNFISEVVAANSSVPRRRTDLTRGCHVLVKQWRSCVLF